MSRTRSLRLTAGGTALATIGALLLAALPAAPAVAATENPIIGDGSVYSADPATLVVDDTLYIFAGRDQAGASGERLHHERVAGILDHRRR